VTTEAGRWVKLTEDSLAKYCDKPTAEGYALCYSDAAKKLLLEEVEVCVCVNCVYLLYTYNLQVPVGVPLFPQQPEAAPVPATKRKKPRNKKRMSK